MKILDDDGSELDADFSCEPTDGGIDLIMESRGPDRNTQYGPALEILLRRLAEQRAVLTRAIVDSRETRHLAEEGRTLALDDRPYPVELDRISHWSISVRPWAGRKLVSGEHPVPRVVGTQPRG